MKVDSVEESEDLKIAIEDDNNSDQGKASVGMQSGDSTSHKRKPSMFADLNLPSASRASRASIPSPSGITDKFDDNRFKNDYLKLRPRESNGTESTNIYTARKINLESELRSLELLND